MKFSSECGIQGSALLCIQSIWWVLVEIKRLALIELAHSESVLALIDQDSVPVHFLILDTTEVEVSVDVEHLAKIFQSPIGVKSSLQNSCLIPELLVWVEGNLLKNHPQTFKIAVMVVFLLEGQLICCRVECRFCLGESNVDLVAKFRHYLYVSEWWVEKVEFQRFNMLLSHDFLKLLLVYDFIDLLPRQNHLFYKRIVLELQSRYSLRIKLYQMPNWVQTYILSLFLHV